MKTMNAGAEYESYENENADSGRERIVVTRSLARARGGSL